MRSITACKCSSLPATSGDYDEEFLLAALWYDVGKAIDPADHVAAGLQALEGTITERTETLIALHMDAHAYRDGTLGARARDYAWSRAEEFENLDVRCTSWTSGATPGAVVCELEEALDHIQRLAAESEA